ncbi:MAG: lysostaphin resistance A-like protein [Bacillaceae bacterium]
MNNTYRTYWGILITYVIVQFSGFVGLPLLNIFGNYTENYSPNMAKTMMLSHWTIISFIMGLLFILFLLKNEIKNWKSMRTDSLTITSFISWGIGGFFLALFSQYIAGIIELFVLKIDPGSENTQDLVRIAKLSPAFIIVTCIVGPILEELVFRKVIFGTIYNRTNFIIAGLLSSLIFAVVHFDFTHLLVYTAMGFTFAFLYVRTKTILIPIFVHAAMNSFVMLLQLNVDVDKLQKMLDEQFISWLF